MRIFKILAVCLAALFCAALAALFWVGGTLL